MAFLISNFFNWACTDIHECLCSRYAGGSCPLATDGDISVFSLAIHWRDVTKTACLLVDAPMGHCAVSILTAVIITQCRTCSQNMPLLLLIAIPGPILRR